MEKDTQKCPYCAEEIKKEAIKCKHCGSKVEKRENIKKESKAKATLNYKLPTGKLLKLGFILFSLFFWYLSAPVFIVWYMWKKTKWSKKTKTIATVIFFIAIMIASSVYSYTGRNPVITFIEPENNAYIKAEKIKVQGTVDPKNSKISIQGMGSVVTDDGNFSQEVSLGSERNEFKFIANNSENKTETIFIVNRVLSDNEKADFTILSPENNSETLDSKIQVRGKATLDNIEIEANGEGVNVKDGEFLFEQELKTGANRIIIRATNKESNIVSEKTITVIRNLTEEEKKAREEELLKRKQEIEEQKRKKATSKDSDEAAVCARNQVEKMLKSPSSAKFPWSLGDVTPLGDNKYKVISYVDAQNSFGAMIRSSYVCEVFVLNPETFSCLSDCQID